MALFGRQQQGPTVRGRARVMPASTGNVGAGREDDNFNNFTAKSRAKSFTNLVAESAEDGGPVSAEPQRITCYLSNWLRMVLHDAGSGYGQAEHLPAQLHVPVLIDQSTRQIVSLDVDATAHELEPYRAVGTREWKETEAVLAPVRNAIKLPGVIAREGPALVRDWGSALRELKDDLKSSTPARTVPLTEEERAERRRTAASVKAQLEQNPKHRQKLRAALLKQGPKVAEDAAAGRLAPFAFEEWLEFQEGCGVVTPDEAAALRRTAGLA